MQPRHSTLVCVCTPITKSEEKERLLAVQVGRTCSGENTNISRVDVDTYRKECFDCISFLKQNSKINEGVCGVRPVINYP